MKEIDLIKSENLLVHLPLEIEDMICSYLKEHPLKIALRKELNEVLKPYNKDGLKKFNEMLFLGNYKFWLLEMKRVEHCDNCGYYKFSFMKNYGKSTTCEKCGFYF